ARTPSPALPRPPLPCVPEPLGARCGRRGGRLPAPPRPDARRRRAGIGARGARRLARRPSRRRGAPGARRREPVLHRPARRLARDRALSGVHPSALHPRLRPRAARAGVPVPRGAFRPRRRRGLGPSRAAARDLRGFGARGRDLRPPVSTAPPRTGPGRDWVAWLERRLNLSEIFSFLSHCGVVYPPVDTSKPIHETLRDVAAERLPAHSGGPRMLGLVVAILFGLEAMTGVLLACWYRPTPEAAYSSTMTIARDLPFGWFIH